jgi:hypothetical protein
MLWPILVPPPPQVYYFIVANRHFEFLKSRGSSCNENWFQLTSGDVNTNCFKNLAFEIFNILGTYVIICPQHIWNTESLHAGA